jgi:hypothetical protein
MANESSFRDLNSGNKKRKIKAAAANTLGIVFPSPTACTPKREAAMILNEFLSRFDSGELIGLIALAGGMLVGLILGIMGISLGFYVQRLKYRRAEILAALKQDMLHRGMSADEICMVLEAGTKGTRKHPSSQHSCP